MLSVRFTIVDDHTTHAIGDSIDTTRSFRGVGGKHRLVRYVLQTHETNETDWLEWKRELDLSSAEGRFAVARQILAFANRRPDRSVVHAGGCGYIVIGAEPGNVYGQSPIDPADLVAGVRSYVGDEVGWSPLTITVDGRTVAVVEVEPPAGGDRICTLQKSYDKWAAGVVFVRRAGSVTQASPAEIRMLEDRLLDQPSAPLVVSVESGQRPLHRLDFDDLAVREWEQGQAHALLAPLEAHEHAAQTRATTPRDSAAKLSALMAAQNDMWVHVANPLVVPEDRSPAAYRAEVQRYLEAARETLWAETVRRFVSAEYGRFTPILRNPTKRNLPAVKLRIDFSGGALAFVDPPSAEDVPEQPRRWGPRRSTFASIVPPYTFDTTTLPMPGVYTADGQINYEPTSLRPYDVVELEPVTLITVDPNCQRVSGIWQATSSGFDGVASGRISVDFGNQIFKPLDLWN
jgi:hypothetical protein